MPLPTISFSESVIFYIFLIKYRLKVLFDQSTEYRYHGTFLDQVLSTGTAVLLQSTVPTSE